MFLGAILLVNLLFATNGSRWMLGMSAAIPAIVVAERSFCFPSSTGWWRYGSRKRQGEGWPEPAVIARDPFRSAGNGVIWQAPDGARWLFYVDPLRGHLVAVAHRGKDIARLRRHVVRSFTARQN